MRICHIYIYMRLYNVPNWVHLTDPISKRIGKKTLKYTVFTHPKSLPPASRLEPNFRPQCVNFILYFFSIPM